MSSPQANDNPNCSNKNNDDDNLNWKILLYVPNLIGHARLVLLVAFVVCDTFAVKPWICCGMLGTSIFLDTLDGIAARALGQCTRFGYIYDIFLDCMTPVVVYGQCRHPVLKVFTGFFVFVCTYWGLLAMSTSWKGDRPRYWPASALTKDDGEFSFFGSILWYIGFAGSFTMIYALDRDLVEFGPVVAFVLAFAALDMLSFMEYNGMYIKSLLVNETQDKAHAHAHAT